MRTAGLSDTPTRQTRLALVEVSAAERAGKVDGGAQ